MELIKIIPQIGFQYQPNYREQEPFTVEGWNYKKLNHEGFLLVWKTYPENNYYAFEWLILDGSDDLLEYYLTTQEGVIPAYMEDNEDGMPPLKFYPSQIFLCGDYSYKLLCIDYELMGRIGQYGASTCTDTYIRIFAELNHLHQKLFPHHNKAQDETVTFKYH